MTTYSTNYIVTSTTEPYHKSNAVISYLATDVCDRKHGVTEAVNAASVVLVSAFSMFGYSSLVPIVASAEALFHVAYAAHIAIRSIGGYVWIEENIIDPSLDWISEATDDVISWFSSTNFTPFSQEA